MILRDTVTWTGTGREPVDLPAMVSSSTSQMELDGASFYVYSALVVLTETVPEPVDPLTDRIIWQGRTLRLQGAPLPRMRGAKVHHYSTRCTNLEG